MNPYTNTKWKLYRKSLNVKRGRQYLFLLLIALVGKDYLLSIWDNYIFDAIISKIPEGTALNVATVLCFIFFVIKIVSKIHKGLLPTIDAIWILLIAVMIYIIYGRTNNHYQFHTFHNWGLPWLVNADVMLLCCITMLDFRPFKEKGKPQNSLSFLEDSSEPDQEKNKDQFNRSGYSTTLARHINNTLTDTSFSIGVVGQWGTGKTYFLRLLKKELELETNLKNNKKQKNKENIIVEFNAWNAGNVEGIIEDFFASISKELKPLYPSIASNLSDYSKKLFQPAKEFHFRLMDTIITGFLGVDSIKSKYDKINRDLKNTGKRLIVFIDDLDRHSGLEIISVLKIIRNTAGFANTFFIVAIDHEYVVASIKKTNSYAKEDLYLKKMFQLIVPLPKINKRFFETEIKEYIGYKHMDLMDRMELDQAFTILSTKNDFLKKNGESLGLLEGMLDNIREIKRFTNAFKLNYLTLKNNVELVDYMLLLLIQIRKLEVYQLLADQTLLMDHTTNKDLYTFDTYSWKFSAPKLQLEPKEEIVLRTALELLIQENPDKEGKIMANKQYFWIYFTSQLFNKISFQSFNDAIAKPTAEMAEIFSEWANDHYEELIQILYNFRPFKDLEETQKFMYAFLLIDDNNWHFLGRAKELLRQDDFWKDSHKEQAVQIIKGLLDDDILPPFPKASLAHEVIQIGNSQKKELLEKKELFAKIEHLFNRFLYKNKSNSEYTSETEQFFGFGTSEQPDKSGYTLNRSMANSYSAFLESDPKAFQSFLKSFFRSKFMSYPQGNKFVFHPWTKDIFGSVSNLITELSNLNFDDQSLDLSKADAEELKEIKKIITNHAEDDSIIAENEFTASPDEYKFLVKHLKVRKAIAADADEISSSEEDILEQS